MAPIDRCLASMARLSLAQASRPALRSIPRYLAPALVQTRRASVVRINKASKTTTQKSRTIPKDFKRHDLTKRAFPKYSLAQAMRVFRAIEVGEPPASVKYEVHINLKTERNGPVLRNTIRLPHPVKSDRKIAVICPEGSDVANAAIAAGAVAVGEESLFEAIREEKINFDRLLCHESSEKALMKANLGRILGPKGLMPSQRHRTIVSDVARLIRESAGASEYRERQGVVRLAVGQLGHSPDQLKANIQALLKKVKAECADISEEHPKELHEVILSTTHGPGLSLSGKLKGEEDQAMMAALSGVM